MLQAPWTDIGALQGQVQNLERQLHGKANDHELSSLRETVSRLNSAVDGLERTVREIRAACDGLGHRVEALESGEER